jgi:hypothetical protein
MDTGLRATVTAVRRLNYDIQVLARHRCKLLRMLLVDERGGGGHYLGSSEGEPRGGAEIG